MKKVAVVTGGTSGMGEAAVRELEKRGWQVAAMARSKAEFQGDVAVDADCRRVAKAVLDKWGRIDALVNSAGTTKFVAHADLERRYAERAPLKAAPEAQDVAEAIAWLVEGARRVTGEIIYVDGGMHIASPR